MKFYLSGDNDEDSRLDMIEQGGVAYFPAPVIDFATSIEKVKSVSTIEYITNQNLNNWPNRYSCGNAWPIHFILTRCEMTKYLCVYLQYGWYWGPISRVASERLLSNEPDGSFIVRDSSADHYIFSLTFKLDNKCSHVRIENHHGKSRCFAINLSQELACSGLYGPALPQNLFRQTA